MLNKKLLFVAVIIVMGMGCSSLPNIVETDRPRNFPDEISVGDIVHVATGKKITFSQLADSFDEARIVYVSKIHSNNESHEVQMQVLKEFYKRYGDNMAICMEMFRRPHQDVLDKWTKGEISEEDLLSLTDWWHEWSFDYSLYKDILNFTRDNKIPVLVLNITREFQKNISKKGIEGLSKEERESLPEIDTTDFYHRRYLERVFKDHAYMSDNFERFYEVQCAWEDIMADSISRYLSSPQGKDKKFLVFIGGGHMIYHFGVPKRVYRRNHLPYRTVYTYELEDLKPEDEHPLFAKDIPLQPADYVRVIKLHKREKKVVLGVVIQNVKDEKEDRVVIAKVLKESPAGKAKLQAGDIILSMDGESISNVYDVINHVGKKKSGDICQIEISREGRKIPVNITFFELKGHGKK